jgi:hypothetical protein
MREAAGPRNWWSHGSGWKLDFIVFFVLPEGGDVSQVQTDISWKEKCLLGQLSHFGTSCSPSFKFLLSMITLTAVRNRDNKVYLVTASC